MFDILGESLSCGGSIINSKWIITARHCILKSGNLIMTTDSEIYLPINVVVIIGDQRLSIVVLPVEKVVANAIDDIALIKVTGDIDTTIYSPICLPEAGLLLFLWTFLYVCFVPGENFRAMDGVFIGFGANMSLTKNETSGSNLPEFLQVIKKCKGIYKIKMK